MSAPATLNADTRLILTESSVDEILRVILAIESAQINERARETLKRLQASTSFRSELQRRLFERDLTALFNAIEEWQPAAN